MVLNEDSGTVIGDIPNTPGVHGIAVAPELGKGFISNGRDSSMTVFDYNTLATTANVKVGAANPDAILYDPFSQRVFTFNGRSGNATAIDATNNTVVGTVTLGGKPEFAMTDLHGKIFVNIEDSSQVAVFDARTLQLLGKYSLAPCQEPSGLAIDRQHHRLFAVCGNKTMAVINADNGHVVTTVAIGDGTDGVAFDPSTGLIFAACGEGRDDGRPRGRARPLQRGGDGADPAWRPDRDHRSAHPPRLHPDGPVRAGARADGRAAPAEAADGAGVVHGRGPGALTVRKSSAFLAERFSRHSPGSAPDSSATMSTCLWGRRRPRRAGRVRGALLSCPSRHRGPDTQVTESPEKPGRFSTARSTVSRK